MVRARPATSLPMESEAACFVTIMNWFIPGSHVYWLGTSRAWLVRAKVRGLRYGTVATSDLRNVHRAIVVA